MPGGVNQPLTIQCAEAFFEAVLGSPKCKAHLGAILGRGHVPDINDFALADGDALSDAEELITYVQECCDALKADVDRRLEEERRRLKQAEIPGVEADKPRRRGRKA